MTDIGFLTKIASICHDANRRYCKTIGDDSQPLWEHAPECPPDPRHGCGSRLWPTRNSASNPSPFADNGRKRVENLAERWQ